MTETTPPEEGVERPTNPAAWRWLVLLLALTLAFVLYRVATPSRPLAEGRAADFAWRPVGLDGKAVDFAQFRGRPIFLNIWATWCGPCLEEMPSIARLAATPRLKDVAFVCVAAHDELERVRRFAATNHLPMTILFDADDAMPAVYRTDGIPATFVIAPDGRIVRAEVGATDWNTPEVADLLASLKGRPSG